MAAIFLRSTDGNDGNAGTQKEAPKATLAAALTAAGAGGVVYESSIHAETQASAMTLTSPGTAASPTRVLCVADWGAATGTGTPTTLATTGTVTTTGNSSIACNGHAYIYGTSIIAGSGASGTASINFAANAAACNWILHNSVLRLATTGTSSRIHLNNSFAGIACQLDLSDCTLTFGATGQSIRNQGGRFKMAGGSVSGTIPTTLIASDNDGVPGTYRLTGVDLSAIGAGKNLAGMASAVPSHIEVFNAKLHASVTPTTGSVAGPGGTIFDLVNSDSGDTNYRYQHQDYQGTITQETTIKRTGGASDGVTGFSRKFVSTANSKFESPLLGPWFKFYNTSLTSQTIKIHVVSDNVTFTDAELWGELLYPGTSGYPQGVFATDRAADFLATPANQTTSSEAWTTTGITTPVYQELSVTITPSEIGWIYFRVNCAKASATFWACPKILAGSTQYMEEDGSIVNVAASGSSVLNSGIRTGGHL